METHDHCAGCINLERCRKLSLRHGCPFLRCHMDCGSIYHACKEDEHRLLCPKEKVKCINAGYGCPWELERHHRGSHLQRCPASVVHCTMTYDHNPIPLVDNVPAMCQHLCVTSNGKEPSFSEKVAADCQEGESMLHVSTLSDISASACTMFNMHVCGHNPALRGDCQKWKTFRSFTLNPEQPYAFICARDLQRDEFAWHFRNVHSEIQSCLYGWLEQWCPLAQYGCTFTRQRLTPCLQPHDRTNKDMPSSQLVFSRELQAFGVRHHVNSHDRDRRHQYTNGSVEEDRAGPKDIFSKLPNEVLLAIAGHLDGFSLNHLSMTCKRMRSICQLLLPERGIVLPFWERGGHLKNGWHVTRYRWLFSVACSPIRSWRMSNLPPLSEHMRHCSYLLSQRKEIDSVSVKVMGPIIQEFSSRQDQGEGGLGTDLSNSLKAKLRRKQLLTRLIS